MPYPDIIPGGSLPIAWQLRDKRVVLVGGGVVAAGRLYNLLNAAAFVTLIAPSSNLSPEVSYRIEQDRERVERANAKQQEHGKEHEQGKANGTSSPNANIPFTPVARITHIDRLYEGMDDLRGADMVLTAIDDPVASLKIYDDAKFIKLPINVADVPLNCDFYFGSLIRRGPLQVLVSTNGRGPKIANIIRRHLEDALPPNVDETIVKVGQLREHLRERAPGVGGKLGQKRMKWMTAICETWSLEQLAKLDYSHMRELLDKGWDARGKVLSYEDIFHDSTTDETQDTKPSPQISVTWDALTTNALTFATGLVLGCAIMMMRQAKR
jgi:precorrin-2 dehydrogenase/sirohydrochlorin ferrochelatase